jgi:uncharacterized OsmC-like protein
MNEDNSSKITVDYVRDGEDRHRLIMGSDAFPEITIDYSTVPPDKRGGNAVRLLCASNLYCFAGTLAAALTARGAHVRSMTGKATALKEKDEIQRTKVTEIKITVQVEIDEQDTPVLDKCRKIMQRGCLITYSLEDAIEIEYEIRGRPA